MSVINQSIDVRRGEYRIIRVDGSEMNVPQKPTLDRIHKAIGCDTFDTVLLKKGRDGTAEIVMLVDDTGMIDGKPVNPKATELYRAICKPGTPFSIHGDVAIVNDNDFA